MTGFLGSVLAAGLMIFGASGDNGAQDPFSGREMVTKKDFNGDGVIDTLTTTADRGSGFGGDFDVRDGRLTIRHGSKSETIGLVMPKAGLE